MFVNISNTLLVNTDDVRFIRSDHNNSLLTIAFNDGSTYPKYFDTPVERDIAFDKLKTKLL